MIPTRRFEVWDDLGKLRTFYTRAEAVRFSLENMFIIERKALTQKEQTENMLAQVGECLF